MSEKRYYTCKEGEIGELMICHVPGKLIPTVRRVDWPDWPDKKGWWAWQNIDGLWRIYFFTKSNIKLYGPAVGKTKSGCYHLTPALLEFLAGLAETTNKEKEGV